MILDLLAGFFLVILVHEAAHLVMARALSVRLTAIGVAGIQIQVSTTGKVSLSEAPVWKRKLIFAAGGLANLALAYVLWPSLVAYGSLLVGAGSLLPWIGDGKWVWSS